MGARTFGCSGGEGATPLPCSPELTELAHDPCLRPGPLQSQECRMGTKIYVGNLPYTCDEEQLRQLFGADGRTVAEVAIIQDKMTGQPRGFAFIRMGNDDDARK